MASSFPSIPSLTWLSSHLVHPLLEGELGILALDFDQTLAQALPTLGDEHFYHFLKQLNRNRGMDADAHYRWTVKIREKISYEPCEPIEKINRLIQEFREKGWIVKVLTSRGEDMRQATANHLRQANLDLSLEDVIFKTRSENGTLKKKDESLISWMRQDPKWFDGRKVHVLFADDSARYCEEVSRVGQTILQASVICYQYTTSAPNPNLSKLQLGQLAVQLNAYQKGAEISPEWDLERCEEAMDNLGLSEMTPEAFHEVMIRMAENDLTPFSS